MVVKDKSNAIPPVLLLVGSLTNLASVPLETIPYIDFPELKLDEHESTEMPFRYVADRDGHAVMPQVSICRRYFGWSSYPYFQGMIDLIKKDADKGFDDLL